MQAALQRGALPATLQAPVSAAVFPTLQPGAVPSAVQSAVQASLQTAVPAALWSMQPVCEPVNGDNIGSVRGWRVRRGHIANPEKRYLKKQ
jgi:hypothetical protein